MAVSIRRDPVVEQERVTLHGGAEALAATQYDLDRPAGDPRCDSRHSLEGDLELAPEAAADRRRDDPDLLAGQIEDLRQLLTSLEGGLGRRAHNDRAVLFDLGETRERLQVGVILTLSPE